MRFACFILELSVHAGQAEGVSCVRLVSSLGALLAAQAAAVKSHTLAPRGTLIAGCIFRGYYVLRLRHGLVRPARGTIETIGLTCSADLARRAAIAIGQRVVAHVVLRFIVVEGAFGTSRACSHVGGGLRREPSAGTDRARLLVAVRELTIVA